MTDWRKVRIDNEILVEVILSVIISRIRLLVGEGDLCIID